LGILFFRRRLKGLSRLSTFAAQGGKQRLWVLSPARFVQAVWKRSLPLWCGYFKFACFLGILFFGRRLKGLSCLSTFSIQGGKQRLWVLSPARFVQAV